MRAALLLLFAAAWLWHYPLALRLELDDLRLQAAWLPRVFAGSARPLPLFDNFRRRSAKQKPRPAKTGPAKSGDQEKRLLQGLLADCRLLRLEIAVAAGSSNPVFTALFSGGLQAALGGLSGLLASLLKSAAAPRLRVKPNWSQPGLCWQATAVLEIRLGDLGKHGAKALITMLQRRLKQRGKEKKQWQASMKLKT